MNGLVVGEDLGTVPDYVRTVLGEHGLLGCMVEWFARVDDSPNAGDPYADPSTYRKYALASVTTHDLPPTAGYLRSSTSSCANSCTCCPARSRSSRLPPPPNATR